jgi:protein-disulfide isomerase-like protein with CxxC motif
MTRLDVVEHTDPICSWAWGTEPKLRLLRWRHEHRLTWRRVMGGLVGDAAAGKPDWDRVRAAGRMSDYWKQVSAVTGAPYPIPMHMMTRSTDPAGRAVKAAERQGEAVADKVLRRFRESIFVFGRAPHTPSEMAQAAAGVAGLDMDRWLADMDLPAVADAYRADWLETRAPNDFVRTFDPARGNGGMKHSEGHDRYAFPTLIFRGPGGEHTVPGWAPYGAYEAAMEAAQAGSTADPRPDPTPAEAFARWGLLTEVELATLCGENAAPPAGVIAHDWGAGRVYLTAAEARARRLAVETV